MLTCRYTNDINKTIHFEKKCKNVGRKLRCFTNVLKTMTTLIQFFFFYFICTFIIIYFQIILKCQI
jgi:hypothetical protein